MKSKVSGIRAEAPLGWARFTAMQSGPGESGKRLFHNPPQGLVADGRQTTRSGEHITLGDGAMNGSLRLRSHWLS